VCLDPGIGFGKTPTRTSSSCAGSTGSSRSGVRCSSGCPRKSTLARVLDGPERRVGTDAASVGAAVAAFDRGATLFRVHDVRSHVEALAAAAAVERGTVRA
jgi:dihydropteroate synthase